MRLAWLAANQCWSFLLGETLVRLDGSYLFFTSRLEAVREAHRLGLRVKRNGEVM